jgi:hypothetical protein
VKALLQRPATLSHQIRARSRTLNARSTKSLKPPRTLTPDSTGEAGVLRTTLFLALFGYASAGSGASVNWDGETLIPIGLEPRSEAVLRMPEPITKYWVEEEQAVSISAVDARTLTIKPMVATTEQRLYVRGNTGKIYIAKLSTNLGYYPYVEVLDQTAAREGAAASPKPTTLHTQLGPEGLLLAMMKNLPPPGYAVETSTRDILKTDDYLIRAKALWRASAMTGLIATIERQGATGREVRVSPNEIEVVIPEFGGAYRYIGADRWVLSDTTPQSTMYFVFQKL